MTTDEQLQQIGTVVKRVGLSLCTVRHYEDVGLVIPSGRSGGGFRLYTDADVEQPARGRGGFAGGGEVRSNG